MKKKSKDGVTVRKVDEPKTWDEFYKAFLNLLPKVSNSHNPTDIFRDVCRIFSLSIRGTVTISQIEKDEIEKQYQSFVAKYGNDGMGKIAMLLAYVVEALELRRSDFLGHVYEALNATVRGWGQFFTPDSVSVLMAKMITVCQEKKPGEIIRVNDPSCGAGALLIAGVEGLIEKGFRQGDILVYGEDLDETACCIFYVQASLLGYAGIVTRMDSLTRKISEGPWYTPCYFAHGIPMRLLSNETPSASVEVEDEGAQQEEEDNTFSGNCNDSSMDIRKIVQGEFDFSFD